MKILLALAMVFMMSCVAVMRPVDILGPGIYCQPLSEYRQRCWDRYQKPWICDVRGMGWECYREYPILWGYTKW